MIEKLQIIHKDFEESFKSMPFESVGRVFMALIAFANDEDPAKYLENDVCALSVFPIVKQQVMRNEDYRLSKAWNGKKGGASIGNENAKKTTKNNLKQPKTTKNEQKQTPNPNPYPNPNPINNKKTYGECENVLLTDEEYQKIKNDGLEYLINELSLYIASSGKSYKSHYAALRQWANRRAKESKPKENNFTQGAMNKEYDFDEIMRRKVVN